MKLLNACTFNHLKNAGFMAVFLFLGICMAWAQEDAAAMEAAVAKIPLSERTMPLAVLEKLMVSPETAQPGDLSRNSALDSLHTMKIVVHAPAAPEKVISIPLPVNSPAVDSYDTFAKAIADAKGFGVPTKIVVAPGTYYFKHAPNNVNWLIQDMHDLTIDGGGAVLAFNDAAIGIALGNVHRVKLENIRIKYVGIPLASFATLVKNGDKQYLKLDPEFAANNGAALLAANSVAKATNVTNKARVWLGGDADEVYNFGSTWDPVLKMYLLGKGFPDRQGGARYLVRHTVYGSPAIMTGMGSQLSEDVIMNKVIIFNSPGMEIVGNNLKRGLAITNSTIMRDPSDKLALISLGADAFHTENFGGDLIMTGNDFSMMGDDALNLTNRIKKVKRITPGLPGEATLGLIFNPDFMQAGNILALYEKNFRFMGLAMVKSGAVYVGTVSDTKAAAGTSLFNVGVTSNLAGTGWPAGLKVKDYTNAFYVRNVSLSGARYYLANNTFHDHRGRAALLQVPVGVLEKNDFHANSSFGIHIHTDSATWMEGFGVGLLRISGNYITNIPGSKYNTQGLINIDSNGEGLRNIILSGNRLVSGNELGKNICVYAAQAYGLTMLDNMCDQRIVLEKSDTVTALRNKLPLNTKVDVSKSVTNYSGQ